MRSVSIHVRFLAATGLHGPHSLLRRRPHPWSSSLLPPLRRRMWPPWRLRAAAAGPPEPPFSDGDSLSGVQAALTKIQDRVRIFFAVLFWMSLFFWGSAWDGRDGIRKNKGPPFRK